jgi:hypothetical protein
MMRTRAERDDELRMLALIATQLGSKGLEDYDPPSEAMRALNDTEMPAAGDHRSKTRHLEILQAVEAVGGETGLWS